MLDFVSSGLQKIQQCRQQTPISRFRPSGETPLRHIQEGKITVTTSRIWETHPPLSQALRHPVGHRDAHQHAQHDIFQVHRQQIVLFYSRKSNRKKNMYGKSYFSICDFFFQSGDWRNRENIAGGGKQGPSAENSRTPARVARHQQHGDGIFRWADFAKFEIANGSAHD